MDNVKLNFKEDAIEAIAEQALERKTGARGLRSIIEGIMLDIMYTIPSDDSIEEVIVTAECVTNHEEPDVIRRDTAKNRRRKELL